MELATLRRKPKMSYQMVQHLYHTSNYPHMDFMRLKQGFIIDDMVDGQAGDPPKVEQPGMIQKKKLKKKKNYGIHSYAFGILINQNHDSEYGKAGICVTPSILKSSLSLYVNKYVLYIAFPNIPHIEISDLAAGRYVINVHHVFRPMKNHHLIQVSSGEENKESNLGIQNDDINVPDVV